MRSRALLHCALVLTAGQALAAEGGFSYVMGIGRQDFRYEEKTAFLPVNSVGRSGGPLLVTGALYELPGGHLSNHRRMRTALAAATVLASLSVLSPAQAGEVYTGLGIPGIGLGCAHPVSDSRTLRGDVYSLGSRDKNTVESGINYRGDYKLHRAALLADWFPFAGSFRLTGGLAFNSYKITLDADGASGSLTIGDRTYTTTAADGLNMQITFPSSTPYLGLGWGHQRGTGLRFSADIGAAIGRATVSAKARGALAAQPNIQANIDKELVEVRDGVGRVRAIPQLSIGIGYSF